MKKTTRFLAVLAAVAALAVSAMPVSAYNTGWDGYDINDPKYIEYVNKLDDRLPCEDILINAYNSNSGRVLDREGAEAMGIHYEYQWLFKHIYRDEGALQVKEDGSVKFGANVELGRPDDVEAEKGKERTFTWVEFNLCCLEDVKGVTIEDINSFIKEKGLKVTAEYNATSEESGWRNGVILTYDTSMTTDEVCETLYALNSELGLIPNGYTTLESMGEVFTEKTEATLKGDADLSGEVDLADLTTVAKYNLNNELYPLVNETAFANADMNSDDIVDGLDTSALIEDQLGKK